MVILAEQNPSTSTLGRKWGDLLTGLGVGNLQIRAAHPGEKIGIEVRGTKDSPNYRVTGKLADTELLVPGGKFALADRAAIAKWLSELGENGVAGVTEKKGAFGLLAKQLADARDGLAQPIGFQTKGMSGVRRDRQDSRASEVQTDDRRGVRQGARSRRSGPRRVQRSFGRYSARRDRAAGRSHLAAEEIGRRRSGVCAREGNGRRRIVADRLAAGEVRCEGAASIARYAERRDSRHARVASDRRDSSADEAAVSVRLQFNRQAANRSWRRR